MRSVQFELGNLEDLEEVAHYLIEQTKEASIILLRGDLGAGKTTLTKILCKLLNVKDEVTSPTFSLLNQYLTAEGRKIYHFDLYRIEELDEALDIGVDEYLHSGNLCLIEWPDIIEDLLPSNRVEVMIEVKGSNRQFNISTITDV